MRWGLPMTERSVSQRRAPVKGTTLLFIAIALACAPFADFQLVSLDPWGALSKILAGALTPDFLATPGLADAVVKTMAVAILGVVGGAVAGLGLLYFYRLQPVRLVAAFVRNIHEIFWALIFLQMFGLTAATGVLALAVPYSCIFAKIYSELLEESDHRPAQALPGRPGRISRFLYAELPMVRGQMAIYTLYRLECGLRASTIMGFIGLPTLGFHLETAFSNGNYSPAWAILFVTYALIATVRLWFRPWLVPALVVAAAYVLPWSGPIDMANIIRFFTHDIVPAPLLSGGGMDGLWAWSVALVAEQIGPGLANTVFLTQIALVLTGLIAMAGFPAVSDHFLGRRGRLVGHVGLVVLRSTPEYIIAFVLLLIWGPSMLPAVIALALHNGGVIAHLTGRISSEIGLRPDAARRADRYAYEIVPRIYPQFLALLFYRWEIIFRESAMLGLLGVHTLGFYADSAIAELRLDRAIVIIAVTGFCGMAIETASRAIRAR